MTIDAFDLEPEASIALDDIYRYTRKRWGKDQADRYIRGLFNRLSDITERRVPWRRVSARLAIDAYFCRYERHFLYWKESADGRLRVFAILHESMDRDDRLTSS
jgi:toxin ParE1/3/4